MAWVPFVVLGVAALGVLVFVHEGGHFLVAKAFGVKVYEFMFGLPGPKLVSKKIGETEYGITAIPFGGYVKMAGADLLEEVPPEDAGRSFTNLAFWKKVVIMAAGPLTNVVFAFLVFVAVFVIAGHPVATTTVSSVIPGTPAARVGIAAGDRVVSVGGKPIATWEQLVMAIRARPAGQRLPIELDRKGRRLVLSPSLEATQGHTFIGVEPVTKDVPQPFWFSVREGAIAEYAIVRTTLGYLAPARFVENLPNFSGPVGIVATAAREARRGPADYLWLVAVISVALGVFNLLPIPPLDGGRVALVIVEGVRRRPLSLGTTVAVTAIGASLLVTLMVYLVYRDLSRIVAG